MVTSMDASPRLSIGLPVYNGERFLAQALDSLLTQTFRDFEIIISDKPPRIARRRFAVPMRNGIVAFATSAIS